MSTLTEFRDHCRRMATAEHKPECPSLAKATFVEFDPDATYPPRAIHWLGMAMVLLAPPTCGGECITDADRALFAQLAGELDDYLAPAVDLFGEVTVEPMTEEFGMDERKAVGHGCDDVS